MGPQLQLVLRPVCLQFMFHIQIRKKKFCTWFVHIHFKGFIYFIFHFIETMLFFKKKATGH